MSASTNFILRDIANELEKIRIILERAYPPAPGFEEPTEDEEAVE